MTRNDAPALLTPVATLGFFRAALRRVRQRQPPSPPLIVQELTARHETLLAQVRAIDDNASERPPLVVAAERAILQQAAASVSQELEQRRAGLPPDPEPGAGSSSGGRTSGARGGVLGFIIGVAVVTYLVGMTLVVAGPKPAPQTPGTRQAVTTGTDVQPRGIEGHPAQGSGSDAGPEEVAAKAALASNPEDREARLELARLRLDKQDYMSVWEETKRVLEADPENAKALSYQSQVRLAMGQPDVALEMLKRALAKDPQLLQAYIYGSYVHLRMGQEAEAQATIAEAKRRYPAQAAWLDAGFRQLKGEVAGLGSSAHPAGNDPHAGLGGSSSARTGLPHGRIAPGPDSADLAWVVGPTVSGTLELDAALQGRIPAHAVVFLSVREAGFGAGPPVAAKRLPASFPQPFSVGPADSMQGERLPDLLLLEARVDIDGDASTREAADPLARQDDVKAGAAAVRLLLRRP